MNPDITTGVMTVREFSEVTKIKYLDATILTKLMIARGVAKKVDSIKTGGKGRPTPIYQYPESFTINIF